jgi:Bacterial archaeo-eukaryotic release factor family 2
MTSASPAGRAPGSIARRDHRDLRALLRDDGPFFTVLLPAPSQYPDAAHRLDVEWRNVRRRLVRDEPDEDAPADRDRSWEHVRWGDDELAVIDALMSTVPHDHGAAIAVLHAHRGATHLEFIDEPVHEATVDMGPLPRLAPIIESRQRALPHLVVETDLAGASITAFDGGDVVGSDAALGDTLHVHRGRPGGWSQRRSRQRAENTWEHDAHDVADAITDLAGRIDPELIAVAGDHRVISMIVGSLDRSWRERVVETSAGDVDSIAAEVVRRLSDLVASDIVRRSERLAEAIAAGRGCTGTDVTFDALAAGRVSMLLVHDDRREHDVTARPIAGFEAGVRVPDLAIALALRSGTDVVVVPRLAVLDGPLGGLLRW